MRTATLIFEDHIKYMLQVIKTIPLVIPNLHSIFIFCDYST